MIKSRTPLIAFALLAAASPGAALAQAEPPPTAEQLLAAYEARIHDAMGITNGIRRCPRGGSADGTIVVCARDDDSSMRLPLGSQPEEGARRRLVAGEPPSAANALSVGRACCGGGGGVDLFGVAGALVRGVDRILHPE